jgi:hypothetical protein
VPELQAQFFNFLISLFGEISPVKWSSTQHYLSDVFTGQKREIKYVKWRKARQKEKLKIKILKKKWFWRFSVATSEENKKKGKITRFGHLVFIM